MKRMKVVLFAISAGGVKKHILDIAKGLDRSQFELVGVFPDQHLLDTVVSSPDYKYSELFKRLGLKYHVLEIPRRMELRSEAQGFVKLVRLLRRERPDILHCHSSLAGAIGRPAGLLCGVPRIIYTPHLMYYCWQRGLRRSLFLLIEKALGHITDRVILVSPSEYEEAVRIFGFRSRCVLIRNGVDMQACQNHRIQRKTVLERIGLDAQSLIVLSVTRLGPQKDIWTLLRAVQRLPAHLPAFHVLIAGDGRETAACHRYIADKRLGGRVKLLGWRDDVSDLIAASDVMVLSSHREGMPYSILEGAAMGKPQIGSNVSGINDGILHGRTGWLFAPGDAVSLASYLESLLNNRSLREQFGKSGRKFVDKQFSLKDMLTRTKDVYLGSVH
jgi:glycosyltransferase involved in cell wall biosynthesis